MIEVSIWLSSSSGRRLSSLEQLALKYNHCGKIAGKESPDVAYSFQVREDGLNFTKYASRRDYVKRAYVCSTSGPLIICSN